MSVLPGLNHGFKFFKNNSSPSCTCTNFLAEQGAYSIHFIDKHHSSPLLQILLSCKLLVFLLLSRSPKRLLLGNLEIEWVPQRILFRLQWWVQYWWYWRFLKDSTLDSHPLLLSPSSLFLWVLLGVHSVVHPSHQSTFIIFSMTSLTCAFRRRSYFRSTLSITPTNMFVKGINLQIQFLTFIQILVVNYYLSISLLPTTDKGLQRLFKQDYTL